MAIQATSTTVDLQASAAADLTSLNDVRMADGYRVWVSAVGATHGLWCLDKNSALVANGTTVITTFSGVGRWTLFGAAGGGGDAYYYKPLNNASDAGAIQALATALGGAGELHVTAGIADINASILLPTESLFYGTPGLKMKSTIAGVGVTDETIRTNPTPLGNDGTVNINVVVNSRTVLVTGMNKPTIGNAISVESGTCQAIYDVVAVAGAVAPFTVTTDRPIVWPFLATNTVRELTSYPQRGSIYGRGMKFSGIGTQAIGISGALQWIVSDVYYVAGDGTTVGSPFGSDVSGREVLYENFAVDCANASAALYFQSNERSIMRRGVARNSGSSFSLFNCYQCGIEDCWGYNLTGASGSSSGGGVYLGQIAPGTFVTKECWVKGGGHVGITGTGVTVAFADRCLVADRVEDTAAIGFTVTDASNTRFINNVARNCTTAGMQIGATAIDTIVNGLVTENCAQALRVIAGATSTYVSGFTSKTSTTNCVLTAADLTLEDFSLTATTGDGTGICLITGGNVELLDGHIQSTLAAANCIQVSAGVCAINDVRIDMTVAANQTGIYCTGGSVYLESVKVSGIASSFSIYIQGSTVRIGPNCDFGTVGTPFTYVSGTVTMDPQPGIGTVAMANANQTATWAQFAVNIINCTGAMTANRNLVLPKILGYIWTIDNLTTGGFSVQAIASSGTGILCPAGITRVFWDGTNFVQA